MPRLKKKIKLTWAELRTQRNALERFELYLPTLKLKQQQLQMTIAKTIQKLEALGQRFEAAEKKISVYRAVFSDAAGIDVPAWCEPEQVRTGVKNIAGVSVPVFVSAAFPEAVYSLFATPPWVDRAISDLRDRNLVLAELKIVEQQLELLHNELKKVMQRVNLFEKIIIPETVENARRIRIALGDRMTAAVARAKIAKAKLEKRRMNSP